MKNKLTELFLRKNKNVLNIYCTAGYPHLDSTSKVLIALQNNGADIIEVGMPYSDPIADGPVIQQSNMQAIENGMTISLLFKQLNEVKNKITVPLILMGYFNPVLQYGIEKFCKDADDAGVAGMIIPDMPMYEYEIIYKPIFEKYNFSFIFLITPQTSDKRIKEADKLSSGFLYAVSSTSTTGTALDTTGQAEYFKRIAAMKLKNPIMIGFGINNKQTFDAACEYAAGAIIGSAYIKALANNKDVESATASFINSIK